MVLPRIAVVYALLAASVARGDRSATPELEGSWKCVSGEFAGTSIPGLTGSVLTPKDGKKTFRLVGGRVETGTYQLDPTQKPKRIDSTTKGRPGTEKGIYSLEKNKLRMCLSQSGRTRPTDFRTSSGTDLLLLEFERAHDGAQNPGGARKRNPDRKPSTAKPSAEIMPKGPDTRRFRMGFTGFVYDTTPEAVFGSRRFVRENGDILAHHIEGVPWSEALTGDPFPPKLLEEWKGKKSATPASGKVYLAISPGRGELKLADHARPLSAELRGKSYDDPIVMRAYLAYCRRSIAFFAPAYLAIGIEVNELHSGSPSRWRAYANLHRHVYRELKKTHPDLAIFASFTIHNLFKNRDAMLEAFRELMPFNDLVAASYYPFFVDDAKRLEALDWTFEQFDEFEKPYAMVETNDAAERLQFPKAGYVIEGSPAKQKAYYERLLSLAQERRFAFVICFVHQDYDALWDKIADHSPELFMAWRDCGLLDQDGQPRPAYRVWRQYLEAPLTESE